MKHEARRMSLELRARFCIRATRLARYSSAILEALSPLAPLASFGAFTPSALIPPPPSPPTQNVDGVNYLFIKKNGIYFVCTTKFNVSPSFILEVLERIAKVFKDYCGVLSEESIRKNFILLYELLDEMIVSKRGLTRSARAACSEGGTKCQDAFECHASRV